MTGVTASVGAMRAKSANVWARDPHDFYIEEEWCDRRLFAMEKFEGDVVDPACGTGRIVRSAIDSGLDARGYDLVKRSAFCLEERDFLDGGVACDNIVSNPPFRHCNARADFRFIRRALEGAARKVALLLPATFDCGDKNSRFLQSTPLRRKLVITPRPSMPPGAVIEAGMKPGGGTTDFAWFVFLRGYDGKPELGWLRRDDA